MMSMGIMIIAWGCLMKLLKGMKQGDTLSMMYPPARVAENQKMKGYCLMKNVLSMRGENENKD